MMAVGVDVGMTSFFVMLLSGLGTSFTAVPPGERDASYLQCAPADTLVYVEWASRGQGTPGADGIDGLVADPEFVTFLSDVKSAIRTSLGENAPRGAEPLLEHGLPLTFDLINRSGCLYLDYAPPDDAAAPATREDWLEAARHASVTLIIDGGDQSDETEQHLLALLSQIPGAGGDEPAPDRLDRYTIPLPLPELKIVVHRQGDHFIVAFGDGALERAIAGLKGEVQGLGQSEMYQSKLKLIDMERVGTVTWLNLERIRQEGLKLAGLYGPIAEVMMTQLGVDQVNSCLSVTGLVEGQITSRTYLETGGEQKGLLALISGRGLTADDLQHYPRDCDFLTTFTLDVPLIHSALRDTLREVDPEGEMGLVNNLEAIEAQFAQEMGFSVQDDLLAAFGQQMTLFDSPAAGGVYFTSLTASIEVKDAGKAQTVLQKLMQFLEEDVLPGDRSTEYARRGVFLENREFMGHTIYYVNNIGDDDVPFAPAFCLTERTLLAALHPQALKAHLRFLEEGGPTFAERFPADGLPPGTVISYGSFSVDKLMETVYGIVPYLGQIAMSEIQKNGAQIDIFSVPSAKAIVPYLKESRGWVVRTENGLLMESRNSLPMGIFSSLPVNFFVMGFPVRMGFRQRAVPVPGRVIIN